MAAQTATSPVAFPQQQQKQGFINTTSSLPNSSTFLPQVRTSTNTPPTITTTDTSSPTSPDSSSSPKRTSPKSQKPNPLQLKNNTNFGAFVPHPLRESISAKSSPRLQVASPRTNAINGTNNSSSHRRTGSNSSATIASVDTIPQQTILKAFCSRGQISGPLSARLRPGNADPVSIAEALSVVQNIQDDQAAAAALTHSNDHHNTMSAEYLDSPGMGSDKFVSAPSTATHWLEENPLKSPCFFHGQFDAAVDMDRVLEEVSEECEYLSHSRLVQTAVGVREVARQLSRRTVKMKGKNIMIVTKARDNTLVNLTKELTQWLLKTPRYGNEVGVNVYVDLKLKNSKRFDAEGIIAENPKFAGMLNYWTPDLCWSHPELFDLVLTLGGDGTVLFTSWLFQRIVPPVLSFSLGSLGFLTNFEFERYREHLNRVLNEGVRVNLKMRFTCTVYRDQGHGEHQEAEQFEVLNELVIDRGPSPYVSQLELYGDDDHLTTVQADGCIFSTPTGSTAYSLSAGGSLVHPDIPAILLTPICPHTLSFRPMLFNDSMLLRIVVPKNSRATAWCAFDGKGRVELKQGDMVTIAASQYPFPTILSSKNEWMEAVSRTLRWNSRAAAQKGWDSGKDGDSEEPEEFDIDTDSGVYLSSADGSEGSQGSGSGRNMALFCS